MTTTVTGPLRVNAPVILVDLAQGRDWNGYYTYAGSCPPYTRHLHRIIEKGARADLYLATRFSRPIIWDVEVGEEAAPIRMRPMAHLIVLSLIALCAEAYYVGFLSGPYGVRGLVLFTSILIAGWTCGVLTGFFGALAARGTV